MARGLGAPAQVDVVAHQGEPPVEAAEFVPDVAPDQHAGGGDRQHRPHLVVLALVLLAAVEAGPAAAAAGDADARLQELPAVVPAAQLGADDRGGRGGVGHPQQLAQGIRLGSTVVVQQPEPLDGLAVRQFGHVVGVVAPGAGLRVPAAGALQIRQVVGGEHTGRADGLVDGRAEAGPAREVQHPLGPEGVGEQRRGLVGAAGVGGDDVLDGAFLADQSGERLWQPAGTVVGDQYGGDDMPRVFGGGGSGGGCRPAVRRVAVHGHRGTGPGSLDCGGRTRSRGGG